jgi:DNA-binding NtrC family response regulator
MKPRALVVDDDKSMVKTLSDVLRLKGWEVASAYSGDSAVEVAQSGYFDVVLMDVKMPGMDGVAAFKAMKQVRPDIRVVLMTAYAAQERLLEAEHEGVVRVLPKPVDISALLELLAATLSHRQPVLLVDNDADFLMALSDVLEKRGFAVAVTEKLDHARSLMAERRPLAVLLHVPAGDATAREAVAAMHQASPAVALILYSDPGVAEEVQNSVPDGWVYAYLQKPFAVEQVTGVLDAIRRAS